MPAELLDRDAAAGGQPRQVLVDLPVDVVRGVEGGGAPIGHPQQPRPPAVATIVVDTPEHRIGVGQAKETASPTPG
jgi:hypothetical protein